MSSSAWMAMISFDFSSTFIWPESLLCREGGDDVDRLWRA
jgi:hypothetical protein